jgi:hypothetical protein
LTVTEEGKPLAPQTSSVDMKAYSQYLPSGVITLVTVDPGRGDA